jgi:hypothetical protein
VVLEGSFLPGEAEYSEAGLSEAGESEAGESEAESSDTAANTRGAPPPQQARRAAGGRGSWGRHLASGSGAVVEEDLQVEVIHPGDAWAFSRPGGGDSGRAGWTAEAAAARWGPGRPPLLGVVHRMSPFAAAAAQSALARGGEESEEEDEDEGTTMEGTIMEETTVEETTVEETTVEEEEEQEDEDENGDEDESEGEEDSGATGWEEGLGSAGWDAAPAGSKWGKAPTLGKLLPPVRSAGAARLRDSRAGGPSFCEVDPELLRRLAARAASVACFALGVHDAITLGRRQSWRAANLKAARRRRQQEAAVAGGRAGGDGSHVAVDVPPPGAPASAARATTVRRRRKAGAPVSPPATAAAGGGMSPEALWAQLPLRRRAAYHLHIFLRTVWLAVMGDPSFWQDSMDLLGPRPGAGARAGTAAGFWIARTWLVLLKLVAVMSQVRPQEGCDRGRRLRQRATAHVSLPPATAASLPACRAAGPHLAVAAVRPRIKPSARAIA